MIGEDSLARAIRDTFSMNATLADASSWADQYGGGAPPTLRTIEEALPLSPKHSSTSVVDVVRVSGTPKAARPPSPSPLERLAACMADLSCAGCGSMSIVPAGNTGRVVAKAAPDLSRRSGGCGLQCVECSHTEIATATGGMVFGRRAEVVRTVLVDMCVQARSRDIDREMIGVDQEEVASERARLEAMVSSLKFKYTDVRRRLDECEVRAQAVL
jgi:hypothetical protein